MRSGSGESDELAVTLTVGSVSRDFAQRALTALRALSDLSSGVNAAARAFPPLAALSLTLSILNLPAIVYYDCTYCQYV